MAALLAVKVVPNVLFSQVLLFSRLLFEKQPLARNIVVRPHF
jgi:hypothetical protein